MEHRVDSTCSGQKKIWRLRQSVLFGLDSYGPSRSFALLQYLKQSISSQEVRDCGCFIQWFYGWIVIVKEQIHIPKTLSTLFLMGMRLEEWYVLRSVRKASVCSVQHTRSSWVCAKEFPLIVSIAISAAPTIFLEAWRHHATARA